MRLRDALWQAIGIQSKSVIHRYNFDFTAGEVFDRVIGTVMTLRHFHGLPTKC